VGRRGVGARTVGLLRFGPSVRPLGGLFLFKNGRDPEVCPSATCLSALGWMGSKGVGVHGVSVISSKGEKLRR